MRIWMIAGTRRADDEELQMLEELIPIVMFTMIGVVLGLYYYFRFRTRAEMQHTVRIAIEKGQELSPELVDRLGEPRITADTYLRRGFIALALALGIATFGLLIDEEDVPQKMLAISALPFFISMAYLALWRLTKGKEPS